MALPQNEMNPNRPTMMTPLLVLKARLSVVEGHISSIDKRVEKEMNMLLTRFNSLDLQNLAKRYPHENFNEYLRQFRWEIQQALPKFEATFFMHHEAEPHAAFNEEEIQREDLLLRYREFASILSDVFTLVKYNNNLFKWARSQFDHMLGCYQGHLNPEGLDDAKDLFAQVTSQSIFTKKTLSELSVKLVTVAVSMLCACLKDLPNPEPFRCMCCRRISAQMCTLPCCDQVCLGCWMEYQATTQDCIVCARTNALSSCCVDTVYSAFVATYILNRDSAVPDMLPNEAGSSSMDLDEGAASMPGTDFALPGKLGSIYESDATTEHSDLNEQRAGGWDAMRPPTCSPVSSVDTSLGVIPHFNFSPAGSPVLAPSAFPVELKREEVFTGNFNEPRNLPPPPLHLLPPSEPQEPKASAQRNIPKFRKRSREDDDPDYVPSPARSKRRTSRKKKGGKKVELSSGEDSDVISARNAQVKKLSSRRKTRAVNASCHQCKNHKSPVDLLFCTNRYSRAGSKDNRSHPRTCHKKFCEKCIRRHQYMDDASSRRMFNSQQGNRNPPQWKCPACMKTCRCKACVQKHR